MKKLFLLVYVISLLVGPYTVVFAETDIPGFTPQPVGGGGVQRAETAADGTVLFHPAPFAGSFPQPNQVFSPLVGIPGLTNNTNLENLLNALYRIAVTGGALLAVLVITFAGFKYMATDSVGSKEEAKNDIKSALLGLLIILSTALILRTISGDVSFNVLSGMPTLRIERYAPIVYQPFGASDQNPAIIPTAGCSQSYEKDVACDNDGQLVLAQDRVTCMPAVKECWAKNDILKEIILSIPFMRLVPGVAVDPGMAEMTCKITPQISPYPGQTAFRPITESQCEQEFDPLVGGSLRGEDVIQRRGTIYGYHEISADDLKAMYPGKSAAEILTLYKAKLASECGKIAGDGKLEINTSAVPAGIFSRGTFNTSNLSFMCNTP